MTMDGCRVRLDGPGWVKTAGAVCLRNGGGGLVPGGRLEGPGWLEKAAATCLGDGWGWMGAGWARVPVS